MQKFPKASLWLGILLFAILTAVFTGWLRPTARIEPRADNIAELRRANDAEPESTDPQAARSESAITISRDLYEGLTEIDADGQARPAAAERIEMAPDAKSYTFHLRPAARWSNGDRVTAGDFVFAWRRLVDPSTAAPYAQMLSPVRNASAITAGSAAASELGVVALDALTLRVNLDRPTPYFLGVLAHPAVFPLHAASVGRHGRRFARPGVMVSNGAYRLAQWDFGTKIVLLRNARYWNDAATHFDRIEYFAMPEPEAQLRAYRAGEIDMTSTVPQAKIAWIKDHLAAEFHVSPQLALYYYGFNLRLAPFANDTKLRQALSMVIDRERLVTAITQSGELPAYSWVPAVVSGYTAQLPAFSHWTMQQRIARARELVRGSQRGTAPPEIELRYNTGDLHAKIAVAIASMWREALDIRTRLRSEEFKVLLQDIDRGDATQVFRASWVGDYNDPLTFLQLLSTDFGINLPRYSNADYDELLRAAGAQTDDSRRFDLLQRAERTMLEDQPVIPLFFYVSKHLVKPGIRDWRNNVMNIVYSKSLKRDPGPKN